MTRKQLPPLAESFAKANEAMQNLNFAWRKGEMLDKLRKKANHFNTPAWQRPFHRLHVRYFLFRHYRHVK